LIITEAKRTRLSMHKKAGSVHPRLRDVVWMTLIRVSNHWLWFESSQSMKNVTQGQQSH